MSESSADILPMAHERSPMGMAATLLLSWLVPGAGFVVHGRVWRGLVLCLAINITFFVGILMHGGVIWPSWSMRDPAFNIVNNLTFLIQLGGGVPALLSLYADPALHPNLVGPMRWLAGQPAHHLFDLSSFYLLVAGAMNYFAVCNAHERLYATSGEDENGGEGRKGPHA